MTRNEGVPTDGPLEPPETPRRPVVEHRHGEELVDPYRWLEGDGEEVAEWTDAQNAHTDAVLATPTRESLHERFAPLAERADYHPPVAAGDRYLQRIEGDGDDQPKLVVREEPAAEPRVLADPNAMEGVYSLDWFVPSPDGELVVYGLAEGGTEEYDLVVCDVESGEVVEELSEVGRCIDGGVAWLEDGFYYVSTAAAADGGDGHLRKTLRFHEAGSEADGDGADPAVDLELPTERWPRVETDPAAGEVVVGTIELGTGGDLYRLADDGGGPADRRPDHLRSFEGLQGFAVDDGSVYVLTIEGAPRGQVLVADLGGGGTTASGFQPLVPESDDVLLEFDLAADAVVVSLLSAARPEVRVYDREGTPRAELGLPAGTSVTRASLVGSDGDPEAFLRLEGFDRPPAIVRADTDAGEWETTDEVAVPLADELDLSVSLESAESTDGTEVPLWVVHRADLRPADPESEAAPAVLEGYGGFRIPRTPDFDPFRLPFLADGGVYAVGCYRGGFEFGESWHEDGMRGHKQHTFDDAIACADRLVEAGYTTPERLAVWGGSNGGLTVGAVVTQRPDAAGAAVCAVPLFDMLRFHEFLLGAAWTGEYGDPDDAEAFEWLRAYSPYHNVEEVDYTATLFRTAEGDTRVHPFHARKAAARMQAATTAEEPVLLRMETDAGHGLGKPTSLVLVQRLDEWGFVYDRLGIESRSG